MGQSNCREDKCYPTDQETWPHIGLSSSEFRGKSLVTRKRRILSEINTESVLTDFWSVERYKVAVLTEFNRTLANVQGRVDRPEKEDRNETDENDGVVQLMVKWLRRTKFVANFKIMSLFTDYCEISRHQ